MKTAREHLNWAVDRALAEYDAGKRAAAMASFLSDVGTHPDTAWIASHELTFLIEIERGREAFKRVMTDFSV